MSSSEPEIDGRVASLLGVTSAVGQAVGFSLVGVFVLESLPYGLIAGVMSGLGSHLFLPWFLQLSTVQQEGTDDLPIGDAIQRVPGRPQRPLFGLGLEIGAIVMLMIGITLDEPNLISGTAGGLTVALVVYLAGSIGVNRLTTVVD